MSKTRLVSYLVSSMLLILLVIIASLAVYYLVVRKPSVGKAGSITALRIEAVKLENDKLKLYIRNVGERVETLTTVYIVSLDGSLAKTVDLSHTGIYLKLWGGDVIKLGKGTIEFIEKGLILYDDFNSLNERIWVERQTSNAKNVDTRVEAGYLRVKLSSSNGWWAVAGLSTRSPIYLPETYVVETELWKRGKATWYYAVCLYITPTASNPNPFYNTPWFAVKLYPRSNYLGYVWTELQLVYWVSSGNYDIVHVYTWTDDSWPHAHIAAIVSQGRIRLLAWIDDREGAPTIDSTYTIRTLTSGNYYLYLTVDNPTYYIDEGWFGYVKVYKGTSITIEGLEPGNTYKLIGIDGCTCTLRATTSRVTIDFLNPPPGCGCLLQWFYTRGFPWRGSITSKTMWRLEPGEVAVVTVDATGLKPGVYTVEVVAEDGVKALKQVAIR